MISDLPIPLQVALVGGCAALIGAGISFFSNLVTQWYSRTNKIEEWLFSKRAEDTQELIDDLVKLSGDFYDTREKSLKVLTSVISVLEFQQKQPVPTPSGEFAIGFDEFISGAIDEMGIERYKISENKSQIKLWQSAKLIKLTTWLENTDEIKDKCGKLAREYNEIYKAMGNAYSQISLLLSRCKNSQNIDDANRRELKRMHRTLLVYVNNLHSVTYQTTQLQRYLALAMVESGGSFENFLKKTLLNDKE